MHKDDGSSSKSVQRKRKDLVLKRGPIEEVRGQK